MSKKYAYVLRSDSPSGVSYGGFQWPESGPVEAPDWNDRAECGGGLHGLLWGCGNAELLRDPRDTDTRWRVVKVLAADVVDLCGKVKFPRGEVVYFGDRDGALALLDKKGAAEKPVVFAARTAGDWGTAAAGYGGAATAGYGGTATAGYRGTATAGERGTLLIKWWDGDRYRYRIATGYVGEDGIEPNVAYKCDTTGRLVKA